MADYDNTNRGSVWRNEKKDKDTHPDFTGSLNVAGVEYWVSAWKRKDGASAKAPALSFSVKPKDDQQAAAQASLKRAGIQNNADINDDIPFAAEFR
jgi:hypothetical protein